MVKRLQAIEKGTVKMISAITIRMAHYAQQLPGSPRWKRPHWSSYCQKPELMMEIQNSALSLRAAFSAVVMLLFVM
jgi:uroporphyrinogen-III decarboxylase